MADLGKTLIERGATYGRFEDHAKAAMALKNTIRRELHSRNKVLADDQMHALDVICDKIARVINGNADYTDNWHDIAGYARLIEERLEGR